VTTAGARPDLSHLDAIDLQALRLGAQVMVHKAELAARPRVELFFRGLQLTVDEELARRRRGAEEGALPPPGPHGPHALPPHATPPLTAPEDVAAAAAAAAAASAASAAARTSAATAQAGPAAANAQAGGETAAGGSAASLSPGAADDRRLTAEYLDLLAANPRLSAAVRDACHALRDGLRPDA